MSKEAGRELIEGAGEVRSVVPWAHMDEAEGAALAGKPQRRIEWIPRQQQEWAVHAPPVYRELLDAVYHQKEEVMGSASISRLRVPDPIIQRVPKHTLWTNWIAIAEKLDSGSIGSIRYIDHMKDWIEADLRILTSITGTDVRVLDMRGFWKVEDLRTLMRRYVSLWKRCKQCGGYDTGLVKDHVIKVRCTRCMTDNSVLI